MAYRLPGGRAPLPITDGLTIEVERIGAYPVYAAAVSLVSAFYGAETGTAAEFDALRAAYRFFVDEAQPTWEIVDHRGVVHPTADGMLRLDTTLALGCIVAWAEKFTEPPPETAVDRLVPPGPMRDRLKAELALKAVA